MFQAPGHKVKPIMRKKELGLTYPDMRPWDLEPHYCKHIGKMTEEDLHSKSDIALQLAYRDKVIESLSGIIKRTLACGQIEKLETAKCVINAFEAGDLPAIWVKK